ncbi:MAG TPA: SMC-Scp complex subunit ScpB [Gallionellaceae bacterium]|nr:SMC-Scp complex subunit ScpB [Gallionellaceae bacterium]
MSEPATVTALTPSQPDAAPPEVVQESSPDRALLKNVFEAALMVSQEPLSLSELKKLGDVPLETSVVEEILQQLAQEYSTRGIELTRVSSGWRFRARPGMQQYIDRLNPQKPPRYSRAVMETLAIIAYRQPVTRGDIEEIRGVAVASQILKTLEARNWIEVIGTRDVPGKPELFATTQQLLDDLNLRSLHELPALEEMGSLLEQEPAAPSVTEAEAPAQLAAPEAEVAVEAVESLQSEHQGEAEVVAPAAQVAEQDDTEQRGAPAEPKWPFA